MLKKMTNKKTFLYLSILISMCFGQEKAFIENLRIETKQNGLFLTLEASRPLLRENLTGWIHDDWFYMTIYQATGDSNRIQSINYTYPVLDVQNSNAAESTQIAIRFSGNIDQYEFYFSNNNRRVKAMLYYPPEMVVAMLDQEKIVSKKTKSTMNNTLVKLSYFTGAALTVSGVIAGDGKESGQAEITTGLIILGITYIYEHWF